MSRTNATQMPFGSVYALLIAKAERKGRSRQEVDQLTAWLTGYSLDAIAQAQHAHITYGDFFRDAPHWNPHFVHITGKICGVRVESVPDPLMRRIRCLDKLVDDLAKGKDLSALLSLQPERKIPAGDTGGTDFIDSGDGQR